MKKRLIPIIIALVYSLNIIPAFAEYDVDEVYAGIENDLLTSEESGIIDISEITEDNVLFQAMQNKPTLHKFGLKKARRKNNDTDTTEISADFDIVMNFDMSSDMYDFDINGDKEWLEDFKAIAEQAPDNTRYSVVSSDTEGFTYDLETSIDDVQNDNYTGENDVVAMLDDSVEAFDDDSDNRNKVVIATTQTIEDADELEDKFDELRNDDIIPFVFVLNEETDNSLNIDGVYQCATDLELRVAISDLYLSFGEFNVALNSTTNSTSALLDTDYKPRHKFTNMENSDGLKMASILNMYKCVPLYALTNQLKYDFLNTPGFNAQQREWFLKANNEKVNAFPSDFSSVWDNIFQSIDSETKVFKEEDDIAPTIVKNLKRRFPIMVKILKPQETNTVGEPEYLWRIATAYDASTGMIDSFNDNGDIEISIDDIKSVFDTYEYILNTVYRSTNLYDKVNWQNGSIAVDTIYPHEYEMVIDGDYSDMTIKRAPMIEADSGIQGIESVINGNTLHTTITKERNFLIESLVTYTNGYPDIYCANKEYRIRFFNDIEPNKWYTDYVFECTNKGIINGYTDNTFRPSREVSRCELLVMLLKAADIDLETVKQEYNDLSKVLPDDIKMLLETKIQALSAQQIDKSKLSGDGIDLNTSHANYEDTLMGVDKKQNGWEAFWGKAYMNYGLVHGIISVDEYLGLDLTEKVVREGKDDIPSNYVDIDKFIGGNIKLSREQSARMIWEFLNNKRENISVPTLLFDYDKEPADKSTNYRYMAFEDYNIDKNTPEGEAIYELFMNGVMNGHDSTEMGEIELLSRAQVCVLIIKCLFNMDENVPTIEANVEGMTNIIEPVKLKIDTRERIIDEITFNNDNEAVYELKLTTGHKYIIQTIGELPTTKISGKIEGNGTILQYEGSNNENAKEQKNIVYSVKGPANTKYSLIIKRESIDSQHYGTDIIGLKIVDMDIPQPLEFVHQTGGKYIYSNNKEGIVEEDLADQGDASRLIFCQEGLTSGKYTMMMEHRNDTDSEIYIDINFYDPNGNSSFKILKYGDATVGAGHNGVSHACIPAYADFKGLDVGRVRTQTQDVENSNDFIICSQNMSAKIAQDEYYFNTGNSIWLSELYNNDEELYPSLQKDEYIYTMLEFELESSSGIRVSVAAYRDMGSFNSRLVNCVAQNYAPFNAPYHEIACVKGIAGFKPQTITELNLIIDDETLLDTAQYFRITNPFSPNGKEVNRWKTHMNPQAEESGADDNTESDIMPFYYYDYFSQRECYFDTKHNMFDFSLLTNNNLEMETDMGEDLRRSPNWSIACNLGNYSVTTTYKVTVQNITNTQRTLCYNIEKESNLFFTVRGKDENYLQFEVNGHRVNAICTGEVNRTGDLYSTDTGDVTVNVPSTNGKLDNITELRMVVPAHETKVFYIDEVLVTCANGSIPTKIFIR